MGTWYRGHEPLEHLLEAGREAGHQHELALSQLVVQVTSCTTILPVSDHVHAAAAHLFWSRAGPRECGGASISAAACQSFADGCQRMPKHLLNGMRRAPLSGDASSARSMHGITCRTMGRKSRSPQAPTEERTVGLLVKDQSSVYRRLANAHSLPGNVQAAGYTCGQKRARGQLIQAGSQHEHISLVQSAEVVVEDFLRYIPACSHACFRRVSQCQIP